MFLKNYLIDVRMTAMVKPFRGNRMAVMHQAFPQYRYADLHRGVEAFIAKRKLIDRTDSQHYESLEQIVRKTMNNYQSRTIKASGSELCAVAYDKKEAFSSGRFWVFHEPDRSAGGIIRVSTNHNGPSLEVAHSNREHLASVVEEITNLSMEHSVYRGAFLQFGTQEHLPDEYEYSGSSQGLSVIFKRPPEISEEDIIFDPSVRKVLERNVVSFMKNRDQLHQLGLPLQRGVLLYGPPGTGKTFTCQFLYTLLKPTTMITVTGKSLGEIRSICAFARMLQPAILLLEDVDLIFASREINLYSTALGEMLDELDAFKRDDNVLFMMTTNAIDRLEEAIKDRPGRVSQCIYMGQPTKELRKRYLERFVGDRAGSEFSLEHIASLTEGASQAFLEELVYRATQIAAETDASPQIALGNAHFDEAFEEMTGHKDNSAGSIVGFRH